MCPRTPRRRRRGIFVETRTNKIRAPSGRHIQKISLLRSLGMFGFIGYKDFAPTVLADLRHDVMPRFIYTDELPDLPFNQ